MCKAKSTSAREAAELTSGTCGTDCRCVSSAAHIPARFDPLTGASARFPPPVTATTGLRRTCGRAVWCCSYYSPDSSRLTSRLWLRSSAES
eukprot:scaffold2765_cov128-Isochrysis_galbana.AAC.8